MCATCWRCPSAWARSPRAAYLGDVGDCVTGDKRAQKFEDDYLDELVRLPDAELGFRAITYMPSRNTKAQLTRVRALCEQYGLFQISGEDINSPRQSFVCEAQRDPMFANLLRRDVGAHRARMARDRGSRRRACSRRRASKSGRSSRNA